MFENIILEQVPDFRYLGLKVTFNYDKDMDTKLVQF